MPKLCPNIRFPHQQDFFPIRSVTKSSTSKFSHENLVEKFKIFVQDFVPIRTALIYIKFAAYFTARLICSGWKQRRIIDCAISVTYSACRFDNQWQLVAIAVARDGN